MSARTENARKLLTRLRYPNMLGARQALCTDRELKEALNDLCPVTLREFRDTRRYTDDIGRDKDEPDLAGVSGFLYMDACYHVCVYRNLRPAKFGCVIGNSEPCSENLLEVEEALYEWAKGELEANCEPRPEVKGLEDLLASVETAVAAAEEALRDPLMSNMADALGHMTTYVKTNLERVRAAYPAR